MKKSLVEKIVGISLVAFSAISFAVATLAWFANPGKESDKHLNGEIGLRGYFYDGDGSETKRFEIVSPVHFYNLARLQNLGFFPDIKYFQVGHYFNDLYLYDEDHGKGEFDSDGDGIIDQYIDTVDENSNGPMGLACINLDEHGNEYYSQYLDMGSFSNSFKILPVGGEGAPFYGDFDGKGIPIRNLKVYGNPEDIGVFGYVSHEGVVKGLICEDLEIHSLGYTSNPRDNSTDLFERNIDNIFRTNEGLTYNTNLVFHDNNAAGNIDDPKDKILKNPNGLGGTMVENANSHGTVINGNTYTKVAHKTVGAEEVYSTIFDGYFLPSFPDAIADPVASYNSSNPPSTSITSVNPKFSYSWKTSSPVLKQCTAEHKAAGLNIPDNLIGKAVVIDFNDLKNSVGSDSSFNCEQNMKVDARLSLIASAEVDGYVYSRVIQSYTVEFHSNASSEYDDGKYSIAIYCDYVNQDDQYATNYHHGNNVGFLAGHVDGSFTNSYVYGGKIFLNDDSNCQPIATESETGLIGEVGTNVINSLDPDINKSRHRDIGIMNLSKIYGKIRSDFEAGDTAYVCGEGIHYISYENKIKSETIGLYEEYLQRRYLVGSSQLITSVDSGESGFNNASVPEGQQRSWYQYQVRNSVNGHVPYSFNSVDFLPKKVIQDEQAISITCGEGAPNEIEDLEIKKDDYYYNIDNGDLYQNVNDSLNVIEENVQTTNGDVSDQSTLPNLDLFSYCVNADTNKLFFKTAFWNATPDFSFDSREPNAESDTVGYYYNSNSSTLYARSENEGNYEYVAVDNSKIIVDSNDPSSDYFPNGKVFFIKSTGGNYELFMRSENVWTEVTKEKVDRGLGVFKVTTGYASSALRQSYITSAERKTKVYYSTAEYVFADWIDGVGWRNRTDNPARWGRDSVTQIEPLRATTLPTYIDESTFDYPFSRDYNYCFEMDLKYNNSMSRKNYFCNTDSEFLTQYLKTKLIDENGGTIAYGDPRFGFMLRSSEDDFLDSLTSYIPVYRPYSGDSNNKKYNYGTEEESAYYPQKSIVFKIDNDHGANISVVANNANVSIYSFDSSSSSGKLKEICTMYSSNYNDVGDTDAHRYFEYNPTNKGKTGTETAPYGTNWEQLSLTSAFNYGAGSPLDNVNNPELNDYYLNTSTDQLFQYCYSEENEMNEWILISSDVVSGSGSPNGNAELLEEARDTYYFDTTGEELYKRGIGGPSYMKDDKALYAHIFKLPKGEYAIGASSDTSEAANIYYLAVQGQEDADLGNNYIQASVGNSVTDVDFLVSQPMYPDYNEDSTRCTLDVAYFSFKSEFNSLPYDGSNPFIVETASDQSRRYVKVRFDNNAYVDYLLAMSRMITDSYTGTKYYINSRPYSSAQYSYRRS